LSIKKIKSTLKQFFITIGWLVIPLFQYIPCASIWFGIMSLPLISYLLIFFSVPSMVKTDFEFFLGYGYPWSYFAIISGFFFLSTLGYQLFNHKKLILRGPYKYSRHPQYLSIIIMTFSLTMISLRTSPINPLGSDVQFRQEFLVLIWILEVVAYVFLAKLEEFWMRKKYGDKYHQYQQSVSFMVPFLNLKRKLPNNLQESQ
jgi:protein-S-isoprenylcysteine O-methyltransferase Ste14